MWVILEIIVFGLSVLWEHLVVRPLFRRKQPKDNQTTQHGDQMDLWSKKEWFTQVLYLILFVIACFLAWYCFMG